MNKVCGVCGDRSYGKNFGALSCESCRSFFRRTAMKYEQIKCFYGENCEINYKTRKFCKKCRLDKCFDIGMRKSRNSTSNGREISESTIDISAENVMECNSIKQNQNIVNYEAFHFPTLLRGLILEFSPLEYDRLKQLFSATTNLRDPMIRASTKTDDLVEVMKIMHKRCDIKCRRIVNMSTNINEFVNLCEEDKIVLLKAGCPLIISLTSFTNFDFDGNYWTDGYNATKISLDLLRLISNTVYESQKRFLISMKEELNEDINILDLLTMIVLFNSKQTDVTNKDKINIEEETYKYLLRRYLELKYQSKSMAQNKFMLLMNNLQEVYVLTRLLGMSYSNKQPNTLEGSGALVEEIYDVHQGQPTSCGS